MLKPNAILFINEPNIVITNNSKTNMPNARENMLISSSFFEREENISKYVIITPKRTIITPKRVNLSQYLTTITLSNIVQVVDVKINIDNNINIIDKEIYKTILDNFSFLNLVKK